MNYHHHPVLSFHRAGWRMVLPVIMAAAIAVSGCQSGDSSSDTKVLGHGSHLVHPVVTDPVSGEPLDNGKYRLIVKGADDETDIEHRGVTDAQGHTAPVRLESAEDAERVSARAVYGEGKYSEQFRLLTASGEPVTDKGYVIRMSDGSVFVGYPDAQGYTAELFKDTPVQLQIAVRRFDNAPGWREQARVVNETVEAMTPDERVYIFQRLLDAAKASADPDGLLFDSEDIKQMKLKAQRLVND